MLKHREIVTDQKFLRKKSEAVLDINDQKIQELIEEMFIAIKANKGAGLAAVQTGELLRIFIVDYKGKKLAFINPEIKKQSKKTLINSEGCLSVPGIYAEVERPYKVEISAIDRYGKKIKLKTDGTLARIIQHEMDHLEGVLFTDKISP